MSARYNLTIKSEMVKKKKTITLKMQGIKPEEYDNGYLQQTSSMKGVTMKNC